jgi:hypothetical protein
MSEPQSQLARYVAKPAATTGQVRALGARAWHDEGIVCLRPEELTDVFLRQAVINAAERLYGKRLDG